MNHDHANAVIRALRRDAKFWKLVPLSKPEPKGHSNVFTLDDGSVLVIPKHHPDKYRRNTRGIPCAMRLEVPVGNELVSLSEYDYQTAKGEMRQDDLICIACFNKPPGATLGPCEGSKCDYRRLMEGNTPLFKNGKRAWSWRPQHETITEALLKQCFVLDVKGKP